MGRYIKGEWPFFCHQVQSDLWPRQRALPGHVAHHLLRGGGVRHLEHEQQPNRGGEQEPAGQHQLGHDGLERRGGGGGGQVGAS